MHSSPLVLKKIYIYKNGFNYHAFQINFLKDDNYRNKSNSCIKCKFKVNFGFYKKATAHWNQFGGTGTLAEH